MNTAHRTPLSRRNFLEATTGLVTASLCAGSAYVDGAQTAPGPRATSGDLVEPKWKEQLTITVGPNKGDLVGASERVLQAAVDYVAQLGGGTVQILPGTYRLRNAVYLRSNIRLVGSGVDTVLVKEPSVTTKLAADSDWYDQEITLDNPRGFKIGDGICLRARNALIAAAMSCSSERWLPVPETASSSIRHYAKTSGKWEKPRPPHCFRFSAVTASAALRSKI